MTTDDISKVKHDTEDFITETMKIAPKETKRRIADILIGMLIEKEHKEKS